jgi:ribonuclease HI
MSTRIYVRVPYEEKDEAKALGAKWDPRKKKWWFPAETTDAEVISRWGGVPPSEKNPRVIGATEDVEGAEKTRAKTDTTIRGWFDGGSRGNPGVCGHGAILRNGDGTIIGTEFGSWKRGTNNEAEHRGCIAVLRMANYELSNRIATGQDGPGSLKVEIFGDSKLVVNQATGKWECKKDHLRGFVDEERSLIANITKNARDGFAMEHVLREDNRDADALANLAMDQMG